MPHNSPSHDDSTFALNRRELLARCGMGFGLIGLAGLIADDNVLGLSPNP
jgi:hypothetical protein